MPAHYDLCDYTKFWQGRKYEDQAEKLALDKLLGQVTNRDSFVDVGGGYGRLTAYLAKYFKFGTLVDPSGRNLRTAKSFLKGVSNLTIMQGTLPHLKLKDNTFDLVNLVRVSHHLIDIAPTIKELARIMKPNGYLIIEVANKINMVARLKAYFRGDWFFANNLAVEDKSSMESRRQKKIAFINHHPQEVLNTMRDCGLTIINILSVSNLRNGIVKKMVPITILLKVESMLQTSLARIYGGPSIFVLGRKGKPSR